MADPEPGGESDGASSRTAVADDAGTGATETPSPRGPGGVLAALDVRRQAIRGFGVGVLIAAFLFAFFVYLPGSVRPEPLYVMLAFVVAVTSGLVVTSVLVVVASVRRDPAGG